MVEQAVDQRGQQPQVGDALALDGGEHLAGVEGGLEHHGAAGQEGGVGDVARHVREGGAGQEARRLARADGAEGEHVPVGAVRHAHALGDAGGATGVAYAPVVLGTCRAPHRDGLVPCGARQQVLAVRAGAER